MSLTLCPSMMCARYGNLEKEVELLEQAGADILHIDIMDGRLVPNFGMGLQDMKFICQKSKIRTEAHLMIKHPYRYVKLFYDCGVDIIYIHPESEYHPITTLQRIEELGIEAGLVISPGTSVGSIVDLLNVAKRVIVMGVNPGDAGRMYLPYVESKIDELLALQERFEFSIGMDGACNKDRITRLYQKGVDNFVLGTAALFYDDMAYGQKIRELREAVEG